MKKKVFTVWFEVGVDVPFETDAKNFHEMSEEEKGKVLEYAIDHVYVPRYDNITDVLEED